MNPESSESERTRTVLLVEDDESTRSFIQRFLERDGYAVIAVDAAEEGIVEAGERMPDVLISGIHLPGLSGIELASFLLAQDPALPVILMTGDPDEDLARRAIACGPVQYLLKPFEWFEMEAAVGFAITQREASGTPFPETSPAAFESIGSPGNPELVTAGWDVPGHTPLSEVVAAEQAIEWNDPGPHTEVQPLGEEPPAAWQDTESLPVAEAMVAHAGIEWDDPQPVPGVDPFAAEAEWVLEPIEAGGADSDPDVTMTWIDLEPVPEAEPATADLASRTIPAVHAQDPRVAAARTEGQVGGDWLDQVDRASYAGPGHGDRVSELVLALHGAMDEPGSLDPHHLGLAARVHEAGRLHMPDADPVTLAVRGADVLAEAGFPAAVAETVRHMHERWDGASGPDRLSGSRIPMGARLLAVADALDHYSSAWIRSGLDSEESVGRAMSLVTAQQNVAFSPIVVGAMLQARDRVRQICMKPRPPEVAQASPIPALAAAESVPFALFASE